MSSAKTESGRNSGNGRTSGNGDGIPRPPTSRTRISTNDPNVKEGGEGGRSRSRGRSRPDHQPVVSEEGGLDVIGAITGLFSGGTIQPTTDRSESRRRSNSASSASRRSETKSRRRSHSPAPRGDSDAPSEQSSAAGTSPAKTRRSLATSSKQESNGPSTPSSALLGVDGAQSWNTSIGASGSSYSTVRAGVGATNTQKGSLPADPSSKHEKARNAARARNSGSPGSNEGAETRDAPPARSIASPTRDAGSGYAAAVASAAENYHYDRAAAAESAQANQRANAALRAASPSSRGAGSQARSSSSSSKVVVGGTLGSAFMARASAVNQMASSPSSASGRVNSPPITMSPPPLSVTPRSPIGTKSPLTNPPRSAPPSRHTSPTSTQRASRSQGTKSRSGSSSRGDAQSSASQQRGSTLASTNSGAAAAAAHAAQQEAEKRRRQYTFQNPTDDMLVTVRTVDMASRTAFEPPRMVTAAEVRAVAEFEGTSNVIGHTLSSSSSSPRRRVGGDDKSEVGGSVGSSGRSRLRKLSPSPQHCEVIDRLYRQYHIRQLCWSPSVSPEADPFYGWDYDELLRWGSGNNDDETDDGDDDDDGKPPKSKSKSIEDPDLPAALSSQSLRSGRGTEVKLNAGSRQGDDSASATLRRRRRRLEARRKVRRSHHREGRYVPIDPVRYASSYLPNHSPALSNQKLRLPMRSDVGFPRATEEEIRLKQQEIARETELEEASPRVLVMVSSDDIWGVSTSRVQPELSTSPSAQDPTTSLPATRKGSDEHEIPLAGKEISMLKYWNWYSASSESPRHKTTQFQAVNSPKATATPKPTQSPGTPTRGALRDASTSRFSGSSRGIPTNKSAQKSGSPLQSIREKKEVSRKPVATRSSPKTLKTLKTPPAPVATKDLPSVAEAATKTATNPTSSLVTPQPNPLDFFAPPVDSSFSSTQLWRSRPFVDRPSGVVTMIAVPIDIRFEIGDIEPLVCTLSLYCLSTTKDSENNDKGQEESPLHKRAEKEKGATKDTKGFQGKISEDFVFPAGDWAGLLREEAGKLIAQRFLQEGHEFDEQDEEGPDGVEQRWRRRKKKALFSYDPSALPPSALKSEDKRLHDSIHVVLEVFKVAHADALDAYMPLSTGNMRSVFSPLQGATPPGGPASAATVASRIKKKKSIGSRLKGTFGRTNSTRDMNLDTAVSSLSSSSFSVAADPRAAQAQARAKASLEAYGLQILTPVCFGVVRAFPVDEQGGDDKEWPDGCVQSMRMYSFPPNPESQDDFVKRLSSLATELKSRQFQTPESSAGRTPYSPSEASMTSDGERDSRADDLSVGSWTSQTSTRSMSTGIPSPRRLATRSNWSWKPSKKLSSASFGHKSPPPEISTATDSVPLPGHASFFTSFMGHDFTQALQETPTAIRFEDDGGDGKKNGPRLLVDVTGDCAIMTNTDRKASMTKKRSNLIRLPPAAKHAGYADSFEVREVLYLPPRPHRQYEVGAPTISTTMLNLLYLYPRLIRQTDELKESRARVRSRSSASSKFYSVRIRLVRQGLETDEKSGGMRTKYIPTESMYSPSPGTGSMVPAVFTKIPHGITGGTSNAAKQYAGEISGAGVALRDEIKMRLPDILDGSFFLQFSLFCFQLVEGGRDSKGRNDTTRKKTKASIESEKIAETLVPLSSSATRETKTGVRVATVIPNGVHRIKLGNFKFHVESRLASSIHISDPAVATVLRDFPLTRRLSVRDAGPPEGLRKSFSDASTIREKEKMMPMYSILLNASEQAVVSHFNVLVFMHLSNMLNCRVNDVKIDTLVGLSLMSGIGSEMTLPTVIVESSLGLFEIVRKTKLKFEQDEASNGKVSFQRFLKEFMDRFDDTIFSPELVNTVGAQVLLTDDSGIDERPIETIISAPSLENASSDRGGSGHSSTSKFEAIVEALANQVVDNLEDEILAGAVTDVSHLDSRGLPFSGSREMRMSRSFSSDFRLSASGTPFSRRAYGASKSDRMRAEAELYDEGARFTEILDDDETVFTVDTVKTPGLDLPPIGAILEHAENELVRQHRDGMFDWGATGDDDLTQPSVFGSSDHEDPVKQARGSSPFTIASERARSMAKSFGDNGIAKRVNTVAQVMIAPCMTPSLSTLLQTGTAKSPTYVSTSAMQDQPGHGDFHATARYALSDDLTVSVTGDETGESDHLVSNQRGECITCCVGPAERSDVSSNYWVPEREIKSGARARNLHRGSSAVPSSRDGFFSKGLSSRKEKQGVECSPGSDVEEEGESAPVDENLRDQNRFPRAKFRGTHLSHSLQLEFTIGPAETELGVGVEQPGRPFIYEIMFTTLLQSWRGSPHSDSDTIVGARDDDDKATGTSPRLQAELARSFITHLDFFLTLSLKSLVLRCSLASLPTERLPLTVLDDRHMQVFDAVVEALAIGLMNQCVCDDDKEVDKLLAMTLSSSEYVIDFLIGLLALLHPAQVSVLIFRYFKTLRDLEVEDPGLHSSFGRGHGDSVPTRWTRESICRVRWSRQLRLRGVELLSTIPRFAALNYPLKFPQGATHHKSHISTWTQQSNDHSGLPRAYRRRSVFYSDGVDRLPHSNWLADLLATECLSICSESCKVVVFDSVVQLKISTSDVASKTNEKKSSLRSRRVVPLTESDLLRFQSTGIHAMVCVYELLLRRHSLDTRFQAEHTRSRITAMFIEPLFDSSLDALTWLTRLDPNHYVRCLWLQSLLYVLQEGPEALIRHHLRSFCSPPVYDIHTFIAVLKLGTSTFQCFLQKQEDQKPSLIMKNFSSWVVQESFNILCATTNVIVDECADVLTSSPLEQRILAKGILDLLLHIITTPQSAVTHLRAVGIVSQTLEKFGALLFLEVVGDNLQHWSRMLLTLMNSTSLSVRSIAADFMVSLFGKAFEEGGNVDSLALVLLTVLPEVAGRELALYSLAGKIKTMDDVECCLWPLRRALADVEDANPADDSRVDPQLAPFLGTMCRASQAIIDGVLLELRLKGRNCSIAGSTVQTRGIDAAESRRVGSQSSGYPSYSAHVFDADEESLFEAANFFHSERAPLQRLRWLTTLRSLHEAKGHWLEAAETLFLCATTITESLPHLREVWTPSRFMLWHDVKLSPWLATITSEGRSSGEGNGLVMEFADSLLEPPHLLGPSTVVVSGNRFSRPSVEAMCRELARVTKSSVDNYFAEDGMEALAFSRVEQVSRDLLSVVDESGATSVTRNTPYTPRGSSRRVGRLRRTISSSEGLALRTAAANIHELLTKVADKMSMLADEDNEKEIDDLWTPRLSSSSMGEETPTSQFYVRIMLQGKKPDRFKESTTIPTFLDWDSSTICRVPKRMLESASNQIFFGDVDRRSLMMQDSAMEESVCNAFAAPLLDALSVELPRDSITLCFDPPSSDLLRLQADSMTFLVVSPVYMDLSRLLPRRSAEGYGFEGKVLLSKRFFFKKGMLAFTDGSSSPRASPPISGLTSLVEVTVARPFPCALSRQRTLITSEFHPA